jgi:hypothetical protein
MAIINRVIFFLSFISFIHGCTPSFSPQHEIIGKWYCTANNSDPIYEFKPNKYYSISKPNSDFILEGKYEMDSDSNRITLHYQGSKMNAAFQMEGDSLILVFYKPFKGQIDESVILKKVGGKNTLHNINITEINSQQIFLPSQFRGNAYINYDQDQGQKKKYSNDKSPLIFIPYNGFLQTQFEADPFNYIKGNILFSITDSGNINHNIKSFRFSEYTSKIDILLDQGFNIDSVYVCLYGYNQEGRDVVNKRFNKELEGNILFFKIDTLKNLLHDPYYNTYLNK